MVGRLGVGRLPPHSSTVTIRCTAATPARSTRSSARPLVLETRAGRMQAMISFGLNRLSTKVAVATAVFGLAVALAAGSPAIAQEKVRVALPTKTYYPTIISETALRQG